MGRQALLCILAEHEYWPVPGEDTDRCFIHTLLLLVYAATVTSEVYAHNPGTMTASGMDSIHAVTLKSLSP